MSITIDEVLGKAENRYFGSKYKSISHKITRFWKEGNDYFLKGTVSSLQNWSIKKSVAQKQHLSSVDCLVFSCLAFEEYMEKVEPSVNVENLKLTSFKVEMGKAPLENLIDIDIHLISPQKNDDTLSLEIMVGNMKVRGTFQKFLGTKRNKNKEVESYWKNHIKHLTNKIENIEFKENSTVTAQISVMKETIYNYSGLQSGFENEMSLLSFLIIFAQLAESIAYHHDCILREDSENFWVRSLYAEISPQFSGKIGDILHLETNIKKANIIKVGDKTWNAMQMIGYDSNHLVTFKGKTAHIIKEKN
ncbi:AvrD family protein [Lactococcus sp.]|uniref:AvrD family protein n=1 Tax=Lactococcus sp. TaxID=44273 RepID=UPI002FCAC5EC